MLFRSGQRLVAIAERIPGGGEHLRMTNAADDFRVVASQCDAYRSAHRRRYHQRREREPTAACARLPKPEVGGAPRGSCSPARPGVRLPAGRRGRARIGLAGQIPASTLFQRWRVRIVLFAHRVTGLLGCCVAVMFNHPCAWVADLHRPDATSVPSRDANVCHLADTTGTNPSAT